MTPIPPAQSSAACEPPHAAVLRRWVQEAPPFRPDAPQALDLPRPIYMYVGRVAVEKNIRSFLELELAGSKVVVGDGPQLGELTGRYSDVHFAGAKTGEELARQYDSADVFVFPSRTDTFGLVMIEALASGVPVAAYDVPGPRDIITSEEVGAIGDDLGASVRHALRCSPERCRAFALAYSWERAAEQFEGYLSPIDPMLSDRLQRLSLTASHGIVAGSQMQAKLKS